MENIGMKVEEMSGSIKVILIWAFWQRLNEARKISASYLQREYNISFNSANQVVKYIDHFHDSVIKDNKREKIDWRDEILKEMGKLNLEIIKKELSRDSDAPKEFEIYGSEGVNLVVYIDPEKNEYYRFENENGECLGVVRKLCDMVQEFWSGEVPKNVCNKMVLMSCLKYENKFVAIARVFNYNNIMDSKRRLVYRK